MERKELDEIIKVIRDETHDAIKHTGHSWIEEAVRKITPIAIHETLISIGIQPVPPFESQKDFAYLRQMRIESEDRRKIFWKMIMGWTITGVIAAVVSYAATVK